MKSLRDTGFVVFDVETTGLSPDQEDRIIEVAALRVRDLKVVDHFHSLLNPQREVSWGAFQVNGISREMLKGAPLAKDILPDLLDFIGEDILVGHNIKFDLGFLHHELIRLGLRPKKEMTALCTLKMAKSLLPHLQRYPLWLVAESLGIDIRQEHRALSDVELTFEVFKRLVSVADRRDIADLEMITSLFAAQGVDHQRETRNKITRIEEAIQSQKTLNVAYFSSSQAALTFRRIDPKEIVRGDGSMQLKGFCHLRKELRHFRIDRILKLEEI